MSLRTITPATSNPVSLLEAKAHCYIDIDDDNTYLASLITAATGYVQKRTNLQLMQATLERTLDCFPACGEIKLRGPLSSVSWLKYYDTDGANTTVSSDNYWVDENSIPPRIQLANWFFPPAVQVGRPGAVQVRFVAGYASADSVPAELKLAIMELVAHWYQQREAVASVGNYAKGIPFGVDPLCDLHSAEGYV